MVGERRIDPRVDRVRREVEHQLDLLERSRGPVSRGAAATAGRQRDESGKDDRCPASHGPENKWSAEGPREGAP